MELVANEPAPHQHAFQDNAWSMECARVHQAPPWSPTVLAASTVFQEHVTQILKSELQEEAARDAQPTKDHRMAFVHRQHAAPENS